MATKLKEYFPMVREREEVLAEIAKSDALSDIYYHFFEQKSDTGLQVELLQKYLFIPLDIFKKSKHNRNIRDRRDAWLTLFTSDEPEEIIEIIEEYPEFRAIYEEGYEICQNMERVMEMFSKELYELDRNTVQYMIDEMQDTIDAQKDEIDKQKGELDKKNQTIEAQQGELNKQQDTIDAQKEELEKKNQIIEELHRKILSAQ